MCSRCNKDDDDDDDDEMCSLTGITSINEPNWARASFMFENHIRQDRRIGLFSSSPEPSLNKELEFSESSKIYSEMCSLTGITSINEPNWARTSFMFENHYRRTDPLSSSLEPSLNEEINFSELSKIYSGIGEEDSLFTTADSGFDERHGSSASYIAYQTSLPLRQVASGTQLHCYSGDDVFSPQAATNANQLTLSCPPSAQFCCNDSLSSSHDLSEETAFEALSVQTSQSAQNDCLYPLHGESCIKETKPEAEVCEKQPVPALQKPESGMECDTEQVSSICPTQVPGQKWLLWQFLIHMLLDKNEQWIHWTGRDAWEFKIADPKKVPALWGNYREKPKMNYEKMARSLRFYYNKGILSKSKNFRFAYKFTNIELVLQFLGRPNANSEKLFSQICPTFRRSPRTFR